MFFDNCCRPRECGTVTRYVGIRGIQGPPGPRGRQGPQGPQGEQGPAGEGLQIDGIVTEVSELPLNPEQGTTYIVENANPEDSVYVYDNGEWVNLGPLRGPQGEAGVDGATPYVGYNGNWWINGADTHFPSRGAKGEKGDTGENGETPYIGKNGNWFIDDTDTKFPSRGEDGEQGPQGPKGDKGEKGDGLRIDGTVDTVGELPFDAANGTAYLVGVNYPRDLYIYDEATDSWVNHGPLRGEKGDPGEKGEQGEKGEKGDKGETGEQGPQGVQGLQGVQGEQGPEGPEGPAGSDSVKAGYFTTLNLQELNVPEEGLEIASGERLPITRMERNTESLCTLDPNDYTIQFSDIGTYEVTFVVNGYVKKTSENFSALTDFASIGFRRVDDTIVYAGANAFFDKEVPQNIVGNGLFVVTSPAEPFELVNLQKKPLYITGGRISETVAISYFSCPIVTIVVKKLH